MRFTLALLSLCLAAPGFAQSATLPDAPEPSPPLLVAASAPASADGAPYSSSVSLYPDTTGFSFDPGSAQVASTPSPSSPSPSSQNPSSPSDRRHRAPQIIPLDAQGNPIPLDRQQPTRILGFIPNFRSVSIGANAPSPNWKNNFTVATHQALDYSSFFFLGLTSITAEGLNEHPILGKGPAGFYAYTWRGFIDKTDGTFLSAFLLPSLLHEDTRYFPLGNGHSIPHRILYVIDRQAIARNYDGNPTPNIANLGGKALTQVVSQYYYPYGSSSVSVLTEKFGYSVMRDVGFSAIREFYPDVAAHYIRRRSQKAAAQAARDAQTTGVPSPGTRPANTPNP